MGLAFSKVFSRLFTKREMRILMVRKRKTWNSKLETNNRYERGRFRLHFLSSLPFFVFACVGNKVGCAQWFLELSRSSFESSSCSSYWGNGVAHVFLLHLLPNLKKQSCTTHIISLFLPFNKPPSYFSSYRLVLMLLVKLPSFTSWS